MARPHVLVLSPHAGVADGLVRLVALEGRYEARRAASLDELAEQQSRWQADVILVDCALLRNAEGMLPLPAPALLLAGTREDADGYLARVPTAKGWLRKDPTYPQLEQALLAAGVAPTPLSGARARLIALAIFGTILVLAAIAAVWLAFN
jgi:hypothetical protein